MEMCYCDNKNFAYVLLVLIDNAIRKFCNETSSRTFIDQLIRDRVFYNAGKRTEHLFPKFCAKTSLLRFIIFYCVIKLLFSKLEERNLQGLSYLPNT